MNQNPQENLAQLSTESAAELLRSLLHKEGTWIDWGKACQQLQKAGYSAQSIFEQTGFQASQQNLIIVAAQVYDSLLKAGVSEELLSYCQGPKSDVLYEFRVLKQEQRAVAVQLAYEKKLDFDEAKEVAKAIQDFSRFPQLPTGFTNHPGDAVAYQCWKIARQKKDWPERSRLIAKGLKFVYSQSARQQIEQLLSDFTVVPAKTAPLMPVHRLEAEEELPQLVPVAGTLPLSKTQLDTVAKIEPEEPFYLAKVSANTAIVPLPGWQSILKAVDPVAIFCQSNELPNPLPGKPELVLVLVDRQNTTWDSNSYFLVEQEGQLSLQWFEQEPTIPILGQVVLVLRQKKIFDENNLLEPWQMDD